MAPRNIRTKQQPEHHVPGPKTKITKKRAATRIRRTKGGLLDCSASPESEISRIATRNVQESPLLKLPGEVRNIIWGYVFDGHSIRCCKNGKLEVDDAHGEQAERAILSTLHLPKVCRQIYLETGPLIYTRNSFAFEGVSVMDTWIRNRALGQKNLITSIEIPTPYLNLCSRGFRKPLHEKFPNFKRVVLVKVNCGPWRSLSAYTFIHNPAHWVRDVWAEKMAKDLEGPDIEIVWHYGRRCYWGLEQISVIV